VCSLRDSPDELFVEKLRLNESFPKWIMLKRIDKIAITEIISATSANIHQPVHLGAMHAYPLINSRERKKGRARLGYLHENKVTLTVLLCYAAKL